VKASHATTLNTLTRVQRFPDTDGSSLGDINGSGQDAAEVIVLTDRVTEPGVGYRFQYPDGER
jgi:hypothetical protein